MPGRVAIVASCRTPFAKSGEVFKDLSALDLAKVAVRELIERKQKGHKISKKDEPVASNDINLMVALKASLKGGGDKPAKKADKP